MYLSTLGLDLSLSGTGAAFVDFDGRFVFTLPLRLPPFNKQFRGVYDRIHEVRSYLDQFLFDIEPTVIAIEEPQVRGQWSAGLYSLGVFITDWLEEHFDSGILHYHNSTLQVLHAKKKYKKSDSVTLARMIIDAESFRLHSPRFNHDEAEAFLYAYLAAIHCGYSPAVPLPDIKVNVFRQCRNGGFKTI